MQYWLARVAGTGAVQKQDSLQRPGSQLQGAVVNLAAQCKSLLNFRVHLWICGTGASGVQPSCVMLSEQGESSAYCASPSNV